MFGRLIERGGRSFGVMVQFLRAAESVKPLERKQIAVKISQSHFFCWPNHVCNFYKKMQFGRKHPWQLQKDPLWRLGQTFLPYPKKEELEGNEDYKDNEEE
ncbi:uncharacterized protein [Phaseolus vulgaris]|uniref:uncharacterized protein isoform X1 n=1 Tax=Phaseolus vulgaris TaxID=3885 RepID=UPI0035CBD4A3